VVLGVEPVRTALKAGKVACIIAASDLSPRAGEKVVRLAQAKKIPVVPGPTAGELGDRLGRPAIMVAGVLDRALARGLMESARGGPRRED
jgi:ribosomal protein L7Ae-like RNA K-turn-binding protein